MNARRLQAVNEGTRYVRITGITRGGFVEFRGLDVQSPALACLLETIGKAHGSLRIPKRPRFSAAGASLMISWLMKR